MIFQKTDNFCSSPECTLKRLVPLLQGAFSVGITAPAANFVFNPSIPKM